MLRDGLRTGFLRRVPEDCGVAVSSLTHAWLSGSLEVDAGPRLEVRAWLSGCGIKVVAATALELAEAKAWLPRGVFSAGQVESLALVRSRGMGYCTEEGLVVAWLRERGLGDRVVRLEELVRRVSEGAVRSRRDRRRRLR
ncbi:hypothetical protein HRbin33_00845 [bacterium HR33]|nr:hypothetical protein HRbin33_00845 [bacterium HR33]